MALWTNRHTNPEVFNSDHNLLTKSIVFDGKIWTMLDITNEDDFHQRTEVYVFDPESKVFTEKNCVYPPDWGEEVHGLAINGESVYVWRSTEDDRNYHLFKFNQVTSEWESVMKLRRHGRLISIVIINQVMYILEDHAYNQVSLITISLPERKVVEIKYLGNLMNGFLSTHNNNVYLMNLFDMRIQKVSKFENGELFEIASEKENYPNDERQVWCSDRNEFVTYAHLGFKFIWHTFDFDELKWKSETTQMDWLGCYVQQYSVVKLNESIYILMVIWKDEKLQMEFHQLDLHPKLTSICLADLTSRFAKNRNSQELSEVELQLPIQLRNKLAELVKWRIKNAERKNRHNGRGEGSG